MMNIDWLFICHRMIKPSHVCEEIHSSFRKASTSRRSFRICCSSCRPSTKNAVGPFPLFFTHFAQLGERLKVSQGWKLWKFSTEQRLRSIRLSVIFYYCDSTVLSMNIHFECIVSKTSVQLRRASVKSKYSVSGRQNWGLAFLKLS